MQVTTKGRYALRFLVDLAQRRQEGFIALKDVSERQDVSKKYLEQIIPELNRAGLLKTVRGVQGGYALAKDPCDITVADVLLASQGSLAPVACLDGEIDGCERRDFCPTLQVWQGLEDVIESYLSSVTLQSIIDKHPK